MTEGELKKQFQEIGFNTQSPEGMEGDAVDDCIDVLDEAKKEFPAKIHKDSVDGNYELWAKNNDAEYHIEDLASDVADWFKKWFGDDEK